MPDLGKQIRETAVVNKDGEVFFYNDIYKRDQNIATALDEPFRIELPDS